MYLFRCFQMISYKMLNKNFIRVICRILREQKFLRKNMTSLKTNDDHSFERILNKPGAWKKALQIEEMRLMDPIQIFV